LTLDGGRRSTVDGSTDVAPHVEVEAQGRPAARNGWCACPVKSPFPALFPRFSPTPQINHMALHGTLHCIRAVERRNRGEVPAWSLGPSLIALRIAGNRVGATARNVTARRDVLHQPKHPGKISRQSSVISHQSVVHQSASQPASRSKGRPRRRRQAHRRCWDSHIAGQCNARPLGLSPAVDAWRCLS
jgi:hypothetical protein